MPGPVSSLFAPRKVHLARFGGSSVAPRLFGGLRLSGNKAAQSFWGGGAGGKPPLLSPLQTPHGRSTALQRVPRLLEAGEGSPG